MASVVLPTGARVKVHDRAARFVVLCAVQFGGGEYWTVFKPAATEAEAAAIIQDDLARPSGLSHKYAIGAVDDPVTDLAELEKMARTALFKAAVDLHERTRLRYTSYYPPRPIPPEIAAALADYIKVYREAIPASPVEQESP